MVYLEFNKWIILSDFLIIIYNFKIKIESTILIILKKRIKERISKFIFKNNFLI